MKIYATKAELTKLFQRPEALVALYEKLERIRRESAKRIINHPD